MLNQEYTCLACEGQRVVLAPGQIYPLRGAPVISDDPQDAQEYPCPVCFDLPTPTHLQVAALGARIRHKDTGETSTITAVPDAGGWLGLDHSLERIIGTKQLVMDYEVLRPRSGALIAVRFRSSSYHDRRSVIEGYQIASDGRGFTLLPRKLKVAA